MCKPGMTACALCTGSTYCIYLPSFFILMYHVPMYLCIHYL